MSIEPSPPCSRCGKYPATSTIRTYPGVDRSDLCIRCLCLTCRFCGQAYLKTPGHCSGGFGGCCRSFRTNEDWIQHRIGRYEPNERRCLTDAELHERGWKQVDGHFWLSPKGARGLREVAFA